MIGLTLSGEHFATNHFRGVELSAQGIPVESGSTILPCGRDAKVIPVISVIIPTRNRPELLGRALASMRSQSFAEFEVLVIDDCSSAESKAAYSAIWQHLDDRFVLLFLGDASSTGVGPSEARNAGIAAARAPVLAFCDDDDYWTDDTHLAMMAEVFSTLPDRSMYIANQTAVSLDGTIIKHCWLPDLERAVHGRQRSHPHGYQVSCDELAECGGFAQLNILAVNKALVDSQGGFWTRTSYEEDRDFFWRAADGAAAIFFNPQIIGQHNVPDRTKKNNLSSSFSQVERWMLSALVSQHIGISVRNRAIQKLSINYEGDIFRHLSMHFVQHKRLDLGFQYARRALAARTSWKWSAYTILLACRSVMRKRAQ
ncbi:glycosyltransferase family A protein [Massilia sp. R2A-15]|uniref:glycosyltransferase family A protein n=1 Tax=Massilia sp. R2A-15 TaxID=3064278 RepID=UPI002732EEC3|nr:glycosyltransferase family A protein [Massilia sp. R2A-15]WLI88914.1 glycosyltransferase family A protein [Massilia sp. R2A-15]